MDHGPLHIALKHIDHCCPDCGRAMDRSFALQMAQCPKCDRHGVNALAILMRSGMTFPEAEEFLQNNAAGAPATSGNKQGGVTAALHNTEAR